MAEPWRHIVGRPNSEAIEFRISAYRWRIEMSNKMLVFARGRRPKRA